MRKLWYVLAIVIMTTLYAGFAAAHSYLVKSSPAADAVVMQAPKEIRLSFNEGIQPRSSTVALTRSDGKKVNTGRASVDPEKGSDLVLVRGAGRLAIAIHGVGQVTLDPALLLHLSRQAFSLP